MCKAATMAKLLMVYGLHVTRHVYGKITDITIRPAYHVIVAWLMTANDD